MSLTNQLDTFHEEGLFRHHTFQQHQKTVQQQNCSSILLILTYTLCSQSTSIPPTLSAHICPGFSSLFIFSTCLPSLPLQLGRNQESYMTVCFCVCVLYAACAGVNTCMCDSDEDRQVRGGQGWARALDVPVNNTFPPVEVCSSGGCVTAGIMNRRLAPCLIKFHQPHIYLAFQKCSAYQWVLLTCQSRQPGASSAL